MRGQGCRWTVIPIHAILPVCFSCGVGLLWRPMMFFISAYAFNFWYSALLSSPYPNRLLDLDVSWSSFLFSAILWYSGARYMKSATLGPILEAAWNPKVSTWVSIMGSGNLRRGRGQRKNGAVFRGKVSRSYPILH